MSEDPLAKQIALYGASVAESVHHLTDALGVSQAAVARAIGVSPPMLSQLVSGQRIKFGNPLALQRLQSLLALADEVERGLPHAEVADRIAAISREDAVTLTRDRTAAHESPEDAARVVAGLLRAVASGRDLLAAAALLERDQPALAEVLRVYGAGTATEARAHFAEVAPLVRATAASMGE